MIFTAVAKLEAIDVPIAAGQSGQVTGQVLLHELHHVAKERESRGARQRRTQRGRLGTPWAHTKEKHLAPQTGAHDLHRILSQEVHI